MEMNVLRHLIQFTLAFGNAKHWSIIWEYVYIMIDRLDKIVVAMEANYIRDATAYPQALLHKYQFIQYAKMIAYKEKRTDEVEVFNNLANQVGAKTACKNHPQFKKLNILLSVAPPVADDWQIRNRMYHLCTRAKFDGFDGGIICSKDSDVVDHSRSAALRLLSDWNRVSPLLRKYLQLKKCDE